MSQNQSKNRYFTFWSYCNEKIHFIFWFASDVNITMHANVDCHCADARAKSYLQHFNVLERIIELSSCKGFDRKFDLLENNVSGPLVILSVCSRWWGIIYNSLMPFVQKEIGTSTEANYWLLYLFCKWLLIFLHDILHWYFYMYTCSHHSL